MHYNKPVVSLKFIIGDESVSEFIPHYNNNYYYYYYIVIASVVCFNSPFKTTQTLMTSAYFLLHLPSLSISHGCWPVLNVHEDVNPMPPHLPSSPLHRYPQHPICTPHLCSHLLNFTFLFSPLFFLFTYMLSLL